MTTADGNVLGTTKIVDNGPASRRWNLVILSEGYRSTEMNQFATDVRSFVDAFFATAPFDGLQCAINVYRVDVTSTDSGADDPTACAGTGATRRTYFDASYCNNGIRRLLLANAQTARTVANAQVPQWHQVLVLVNSTIDGGSGGAIGVFAKGSSWQQVAIHEIGHSAFGLADEYEYYVGCGAETDRDRHPAVEPIEPNVTVDRNRATIKWRDLIAPTTAVPTTANADCTQCDPQPSPVPVGTVGAFEGAHYYHCDAFRPEFACKMRAVASPFCAVCRRVIRQTLQPFLARITGPWVGVQHRSTIAAGQTVRFFTFDWPACWHVAWTVVPTTPRPGAPQIRWRVQVERATHDRITYWIPVTNLTGSPVGIELRYELLATN
jgi:hypothetical protein